MQRNQGNRLYEYQEQTRLRAPQGGGAVMASPAPTLNSTVSAQDKQLGGLADAAQGLMGAGMGVYKDVEATRAVDAVNKYRQELSAEQIRYTTENQGENALNAGDHFKSFSEQKAQEIADSLGSGPARDHFLRQAVPQALHFYEQGTHYGLQQKQAWQKSVIQGSEAAFLQTVAQNPYDREYMANQFFSQVEAFQAAHPGMDARAYAADLQRKTVNTRLGALASAGDYAAIEAEVGGLPSLKPTAVASGSAPLNDQAASVGLRPPTSDAAREWTNDAGRTVTDAGGIVQPQSDSLDSRLRGNDLARGGNDGSMTAGASAQGRLAGILPPSDLLRWQHVARTERARAENTAIAQQADDMAISYLERIKNGEDATEVQNEILALDKKVRGPVRQLFTAHHQLYKQELKEQTEDGVQASRDLMANMNLGEAYKHWQSLPVGTAAERKVKERIGKDYEVMATHGGISKTTDPTAFSDIMDAMSYGEIKTEKELRTHPLATKVSIANLDKLARDLKGMSELADHTLQDAYIHVINKPKTSWNDADKVDFGKFKDWAHGMVMDSKKGKEPDYPTKLAGTWRMKGGSGFWGFGNSNTFGKSMNDPKWLPDLEGDEKKGVDELFSKDKKLRDHWTAKYGGDEKLGKRGYYKKYLESQIGPRRRGVDAAPSVSGGLLRASAQHIVDEDQE